MVTEKVGPVWLASPQGEMFYRRTRTFPQWNGNGFISGLGSQTLNRIIFDARGGAKTVERWDVGKRIRDVEQAPDGSRWMLEDANSGAMIHVTPKVIGAQWASDGSGSPDISGAGNRGRQSDSVD